MDHTISAEALAAARSLVASEGQWTKCAYARGEAGQEVHHLDAAATSFCSMGAVAKILGHSREGITQLTAKGFFEPLERALGGRSKERDERGCLVQAFNDYTVTTHEQILAMFDKAIEHARVGAESAQTA